MFSFPHITTHTLRAVISFLEKPSQPSLPDTVRQVVPRKLLRAASVMQLPPLIVFCVSVALSEEQPQPLAELLCSWCQWLMERPVGDLFALEADIRSSSQPPAIDQSRALDLLWYARYRFEFGSKAAPAAATATYVSSQSRWKSVYSETRMQTALHRGFSSVLREELSLWDNYVGPCVETLDLSGSQAITDEVVDTVSRLCPVLHVIDLHGCSNVGRPAIAALLTKHLPLRQLNLQGTAVPEDVVPVLQEHFPGIEISL